MIRITTLIKDGAATTNEILELMKIIYKLAPKGTSVTLERKEGIRQGPVGEEQRKPATPAKGRAR